MKWVLSALLLLLVSVSSTLGQSNANPPKGEPTNAQEAEAQKKAEENRILDE